MENPFFSSPESSENDWKIYEPKNNKKIIGYTTGTFDLIHFAHINLLKTMKELCDIVIIGLTTDELAIQQKRKPVMSYSQRKEILENFKYVNIVIPHKGDPKELVWKKLKFDILFIGDEYLGSSEYKNFENLGLCQVKYIPSMDYHSSEIISSLEKRILEDLNILASGISGPLIHYKSKDNNIVIKPVAIGLSEYLFSGPTRTSNVYEFPFPPPRNWKKLGIDENKKVINISGINSMREVAIHDFIWNKPWNPVYKIKKVYEITQELLEILKPIEKKEDWTHVGMERGRPVEMYFIYQKNAGIPLSKWVEQEYENPFFFHQLYRIIIKIEELITNELRNRSIIHGDIHADNVCIMDLKDIPSNPKEFQISFIDFGWCMSSYFEMTEEENKYFQECIETNFDWKHFIESFEYSFHDKPWFPIFKNKYSSLFI